MSDFNEVENVRNQAEVITVLRHTLSSTLGTLCLEFLTNILIFCFVRDETQHLCPVVNVKPQRHSWEIWDFFLS